MSVDLLPPLAEHIISGTGPYPIGHEYTADSIVAVVAVDGVETVLAAADYSVSPASGTDGDVTLSASAATTYDGQSLYLVRQTAFEQGWLPVYSPREDGLAAALDRLSMLTQDLDRRLGATARVADLAGGLAAVTGTAAARASTTLVFTDDGAGIEAGPTVTELEGWVSDALVAYNAILALAPITFPFDCGLVSDAVLTFSYDMGSV